MVHVPKRERKEYDQLREQYKQLEISFARPDDEEALAKWILKQQPEFFRDHRPYVRYLQFLFDSRCTVASALRDFEVHAGYAVSGMVSDPKPILNMKVIEEFEE